MVLNDLDEKQLVTQAGKTVMLYYLAATINIKFKELKVGIIKVFRFHAESTLEN